MIWEVCKPFPSVLGLQEWAKFAFFVIFCASGLVSGSQSGLQLAPFGRPCSWAPAPVAEHPMCFRAFWWHSSLCWSVCFGVVFFSVWFCFFCFELFLTLWSCVGFSVSFLFSAVNVIFFFVLFYFLMWFCSCLLCVLFVLLVFLLSVVWLFVLVLWVSF